ncbi:MAG: transposase [bacterium]|nr:transposase [bacterium]
MERKFEFSEGEFYHLYNRGNGKANIFLTNDDRKRFLKLLYICNSSKPVVFKTIQGLPLDKIERGETIVNIGAYCLMPNHFHILAREKIKNGISVFMGKLLTAYSMYFNKKHERTGKLFEGVFRAVHADSDRYLEHLFIYIHLNPVKIVEPKWKEKGVLDSNNAKQFLENYLYSSYLDYSKDGISREEKAIIGKENFPEYFENFKEFDFYVNEWLNYPRTPLGNTVDASF